MGYVTRGSDEDDDAQDAAQSGDPAEPKRRAKPLDPLAPSAAPLPPPQADSSQADSPPPSLDKPDDDDSAADDSDDDGDEILDAEIEEVVVDGELEYELDEWAVESREMLAQLLTGADIAYVWQGGTLVVAAADERKVDELVDHVETTTLPTLDPDADKVSYEIDDLDDFQQDHLFDLLDGQEIPYELDAEGELVVLASDEDAVDVIMEAIDFPNALAPGEDGPDELDAAGLPVASDVISDLFVAVDRLQHKATDAKGVLGVVEATDHLPKLRVPYGFDTALWNRIKEDGASLRDLLEDDESDDEDIEDAAKRLRRMLQDVV